VEVPKNIKTAAVQKFVPKIKITLK